MFTTIVLSPEMWIRIVIQSESTHFYTDNVVHGLGNESGKSERIKACIYKEAKSVLNPEKSCPHPAEDILSSCPVSRI
jgi:hypothetical protein